MTEVGGGNVTLEDNCGTKSVCWEIDKEKSSWNFVAIWKHIDTFGTLKYFQFPNLNLLTNIKYLFSRSGTTKYHKVISGTTTTFQLSQKFQLMKTRASRNILLESTSQRSQVQHKYLIKVEVEITQTFNWTTQFQLVKAWTDGNVLFDKICQVHQYYKEQKIQLNTTSNTLTQ